MLIIAGNGKGCELVAHSLKERYQPLFVVDDFNPKPPDGVHYIGGITHLQWAEAKYMTISVSSPVLRYRIWDNYSRRFEMIGVHRSGWPATTKVGHGNIIFPDVHIDHFTEIGDNNVISALCCIAHHNKIGSHNLFGPGCLFSGSVTIGSKCTFGSGIIVQPNVIVGDEVTVPSGTVIVRDIPSGTHIRAKQDLRHKGIYQGDRIAR